MTEQRNGKLPQHVGVVGGGRMGAGIAHAFLMSGAQVTVIERDEVAVHGATTRVHRDVQRSIDRGATATLAEITDQLSVTDSIAHLGNAGLVVEAVPEDPQLKRETLANIEAAVSDTAVIATNTSSIPLATLSTALTRPMRLIGMHFFNPVPASALVEIVVGADTGDAIVTETQGWVRALGKTPITVQDAPGFASSRLGVMLALEAIRMVEEGVASAHDIDTAMELGYRHPAGPLRTTDLVGLDVRLAIAEQLAEAHGERFTPPQLLRDLVANGKLGKKTGEGFYRWQSHVANGNGNQK